MTLLTADQILGAKDSSFEIVKCPEWGGDVRIIALSGSQRDQFEMSLVEGSNVQKRRGAHAKPKAKQKTNIRARMVYFAAVDDKGKRLFTEKQVAELGDKAAAPLDRCFEVARRLSGMTDADVEELEGE